MANLPRFLVEDGGIVRDKFFLGDVDQISKARKILRLQKGGRIILFDGVGNEYIGVLGKLTKDIMSGTIIDEETKEENWPYIFY